MSLILCEIHFFPTQTLYNTHQNILHNIHNLHEDRRKFRLTFKDDDNRRMPFRISSSKNDVLTKKSLADLISCVYIFIILQKLDMPKTSYIYTSPSSEIWWSISELWIKGLNIGKTNQKSFVEGHILSCVLILEIQIAGEKLELKYVHKKCPKNCNIFWN